MQARYPLSADLVLPVTESSQDPPDNTSRLLWRIVVVLLPVALLNYLDRQMLASMKFSVMAEITDIGKEGNWGLMLGQFKWVYAFFSPFGGWIADRFGRRFTICGSLFVWSAVTLWTGQVRSFQELMWARSLMGISEAFYIPAGLALIMDYHAGPTRSFAVGLHQMAIYCGVIIGGFAGYAADHPSVGWRMPFIVCGIFGMIYAVPLAMLIRDRLVVRTEMKRPVHRSMIDLARNGSFLLLVAYFTLPAMAAWIIRDWMPAILKEQFQLTQGLAGVSATLSWQLSAIVGVIGGGWLADRLMNHSNRGRIAVSATGMLLIVPAIFGVGYATNLTMAVLFLILFGIGWGFFDGNNMPILSQIVPANQRATGYGIMNFFSISCGGFADWLMGFLRDQNVPLNLIFGQFALIAVISVVCVLLIRPRTILILEESQR